MIARTTEAASPTQLAHTEVAIAGDGGHDGQAVQHYAVVGAGGDAPGHHGLPAHGFGFGVHDAAAGKDLRRARFHVVADDRRAIGRNGRAGAKEKSRRERAHACFMTASGLIFQEYSEDRRTSAPSPSSNGVREQAVQKPNRTPRRSTRGGWTAVTVRNDGP